MGALACSLVALMLAGGAVGTKQMDVVVQDDAIFLHRPAMQVRANAKRLRDLGVTRLRLTAGWSELAPDPSARQVPPAPFDASDPRTYEQAKFRGLDTAVKAAVEHGITPMIDLAFWAPRWAVDRRASNPRRNRHWVDAKAFGDFAAALAKRYSGAYPDPADPRKDLPAVRTWTTWNEPNHPSFLAPQWVRTADGGWRPESPHIYRAMHNEAYAKIKAVSRQNKVLVGGTASTGSAVAGQGGVPPLEFLRTMACVDEALKPLDVPECKGYQPVKADGWAHHPYSRLTTPDAPAANPGDAPIGELGKLGELLRKLQDGGRIDGRWLVWNTEFGYESKQDDPFQPFTRDQQALFLSWSSFLAWKDPDTTSMAQFLLQDIDPAESGRTPGTRGYYRDWQTGLYTFDGQPKPAVQAFRMPFWAQVQGTGDKKAVVLFGTVRPGKGQRTVKVEREDPRTGQWSAVQTYGRTCDADTGEFLTDGAGTFFRAAAATGEASRYRLAWRKDDGGGWEVGVPVPVAADATQAPPVQQRSSLLAGL